MADDLASEALSSGEYAASATFDAKLASGGSIEDAVNAGIKMGATVAATAACAATGVGAVVAPLCGWLGGEVIGPIVSAIGDAIEWIGDLFSSSPPPPILIEPKDLAGVDPAVILMNRRIYAYVDQAKRVDVILARRYVDVIKEVGKAVEALGGEPDPDRIMAKISERLPLVYYGDFGWGSQVVDSIYVPEDLRDPNDPKGYDLPLYLGRLPPSAVEADEALMRQMSLGAITPEQCLNGVTQVLDDALAWSETLDVESARILMLATLGDVWRGGLTTTDPSRIAPHALEPDAKKIAAVRATLARGIWPDNYLRANGITAGVQFLGGGKPIQLRAKV